MEKEGEGVMEEIVGKNIAEAFINEDKKSILLVTKEGEKFYLNCDGDCCSETWIEHIHGFYWLVKSTIKSVEEVYIGKVIPTRQDCDELYCLKIFMEQPKPWGSVSEFQIEFRNSSNGYYGGSIELSHSPLEGVYAPLKEDF